MCETFVWKKVLPTGVEPVTLGLLDPRSNRLSYESLTALGKRPNRLDSLLTACAKSTARGDRTHDHTVKSRALYRLS